MNTSSPLAQRDALVRAHLSLADAIASSFFRRYHELVECEDLIQVARLELVRAAARVVGDRPVPYLRQCITGALKHHIRDRALLVRRPKGARCEGPWSHLSLDAQLEGGGCLLDQLEAPVTGAAVEPQPLPQALEALLDQLPAAQAVSLRLTILEGFSIRQAAGQLGISPMTVQRAQKQALATLRQQVSA